MATRLPKYQGEDWTEVWVESDGNNLGQLGKWLMGNVGLGDWLIRIEPNHEWSAFYYSRCDRVEVRFREASRAVMFKLVWGGK